MRPTKDTFRMWDNATVELARRAKIPIALPAKTIERVKGTLGTKNYEPFGYIISADRPRTYEAFNIGTP